MTQTTAPTAEHILAWLAEQPCPKCGGSGWGWNKDARRVKDRECGGSGLAFEWAGQDCRLCQRKRSEELYVYPGSHLYRRCPDCKNSRRVPKAVGLEDIVTAIAEMGLDYNLSPRMFTISRGQEPGDVVAFCGIGEGPTNSPCTVWAETPTLAALRAVAAQAGMPT